MMRQTYLFLYLVTISVLLLVAGCGLDDPTEGVKTEDVVSLSLEKDNGKTDKDGDEADGYDEALYLYDGVLIDDDIKDILDKIPEGVTVILIFDCCYSGTITKSVVPKPEKTRFVQLEREAKEVSKVRSRVAINEGQRWITFSGSGEHQTSADAYIDGQYNGAFTYFAMKALQPGITYNQWFYRVKNLFETSRFEQRPQMEGNEALRNNLVFS